MSQPSLLCSLKTSWLRPWLFAELAQLGVMHHYTGQPSGDAHLVGSCGDICWFAVADGVGSEPNSHLGSQTACAAVDKHLRSAIQGGATLSEAIVKDAMAAARLAVLALSPTYGHAAQTFATTLIVAVITPDRIYGGNIGDSSLVLLSPDRDGKLQLSAFVSAPQPQTQIYSLLTDQWDRVAAFASVAAATVVAVVGVTDGANSFITDGGDQNGNAFDPRMLAYMEDRLKVLTPLRFINLFAQYLSDLPEGDNKDDRTMVLAFRPPPNLAPPAAQSR